MQNRKDTLQLILIGITPSIILIVVSIMDMIGKYNAKTFNVPYYFFYMQGVTIMIGLLLALASTSIKEIYHKKLSIGLITINIVVLLCNYSSKFFYSSQLRLYVMQITFGVYFCLLMVSVYGAIKDKKNQDKI